MFKKEAIVMIVFLLGFPIVSLILALLIPYILRVFELGPVPSIYSANP